MAKKKELRELCRLFLRLGLTAFGGPAAHIALMQREVVERRGWMDHDHFLDLIGATNLIPGPNSTEMAIHIGQERGGWRGLLVAGLLGANEIYVLFGAGLLAFLWAAGQRRGDGLGGFIPVLLQIPAVVVSNARIFLSFLKIGAILYGSGYVLFAFLDSELVAKGLLSRKVLIDAIAVGQFTPGPAFSSVTFIGWQMGGWRSAALATLAIFLPSFVFVALSHPLVPRMRRSKLFSAFLDGVNAASVAIILMVCVDFGRATITDWRTITIAVAGAIVIFGFPRVNNALVILGGSVLGYLLWTV